MAFPPGLPHHQKTTAYAPKVSTTPPNRGQWNQTLAVKVSTLAAALFLSGCIYNPPPASDTRQVMVEMFDHLPELRDFVARAVQSPFFTYATGAQIIAMGIERCEG